MKKTEKISRRDFVKNSTIIAAGTPFLHTLVPITNPKEGVYTQNTPIALRWLEQPTPQNTLKKGLTWGMPWERGTVKKGSSFVVNDGIKNVPTQSWALAYWPDGSLKWTAHAIAPTTELGSNISISTGDSSSSEKNIIVTESNESIEINTGIITCQFNKSGNNIIHKITRNGNVTAQNGKLVLQVQNHANDEANDLKIVPFEGKIDKISIEQKGSIRTVIKVEGKHANAERAWLPFVIRLYFYAGTESIRIVHTVIFDGDEQHDFIRGLGIRFDVPLREQAYNRHIRFVGENKGVFAEAIQGLTGLRRDAGETVLNNQVLGKRITPEQFAPKFNTDAIKYIPQWGDYSLAQLSPDAFDIKKRTKAGYSWIQSGFGGRSEGTAYLGTASGGMAFGIRNFWQSFPAQLDIKNAHTDNAEVTLWLWSPKSSPMDLRFYHDGMEQDTYEKQIAGLDITYEDYEPQFGSPIGVARTSEVQLWALAETPSNDTLVHIAEQIQKPPLLVVAPEYLQKVRLFGEAFSASKGVSEKEQTIDKQLDFFFNYYKKEVDQRHWYGFWNYGDVMHTYDKDRHVWRYDVGGFAWDNSELSTDLWLWYYFLKTGRSDVFRMAEAMTRHTGEVDVHHIGRFSPLGSRHNVLHWGCSAKQLRISTAANRRFYYYLTGDERVGDLLKEQVEAYKKLKDIIPGRKVGQKGPDASLKGNYASIAFGTDWGAIASAWFTEWERTENPVIKERLLNSMQTIGEQPHGFLTGDAIMDLTTGKYLKEPQDKILVSHLSAAFGLAEICAELIDVTNVPVFEKAWLQYCTLYNAKPEEQKAVLGKSLDKLNLQQGHARLTAFAAKRTKNNDLAKRAWEEFYEGEGGIKKIQTTTKHITGTEVLNPIDEAPGVSTNSTAQWCLAAMQCMAYSGDK